MRNSDLEIQRMKRNVKAQTLQRNEHQENTRAIRADARSRPERHTRATHIVRCVLVGAGIDQHSHAVLVANLSGVVKRRGSVLQLKRQTHLKIRNKERNQNHEECKHWKAQHSLWGTTFKVRKIHIRRVDESAMRDNAGLENKGTKRTVSAASVSAPPSISSQAHSA